MHRTKRNGFYLVGIAITTRGVTSAKVRGIGRRTEDEGKIVVERSRRYVSHVVGCGHEAASRVMNQWNKEETI